jgi:hypothetical protein
MAGLVPAIHVSRQKKDVDARHEAGHDGRKVERRAPELLHGKLSGDYDLRTTGQASSFDPIDDRAFICRFDDNGLPADLHARVPAPVDFNGN